jgi:hypothetical protein
VLFELVQGIVEIGSGVESGAGGSLGVSAGEGGGAGAADPGEEVGEVGDGWVEAHGGVGGFCVLDQIFGDLDGALDAGIGDRG